MCDGQSWALVVTARARSSAGWQLWLQIPCIPSISFRASDTSELTAAFPARNVSKIYKMKIFNFPSLSDLVWLSPDLSKFSPLLAVHQFDKPTNPGEPKSVTQTPHTLTVSLAHYLVLHWSKVSILTSYWLTRGDTVSTTPPVCQSLSEYSVLSWWGWGIISRHSLVTSANQNPVLEPLTHKKLCHQTLVTSAHSSEILDHSQAPISRQIRGNAWSGSRKGLTQARLTPALSLVTPSLSLVTPALSLVTPALVPRW